MERKEVIDSDDDLGQSGRTMTGADVQQLRLQLGFTQAELASALRLGESPAAGRTIRRWESRKEEPVSGPVQIALGVLAARARRAQSGEMSMSKSDVIELDDGEAQPMGDGVFVLFQDVGGRVETVVVTPRDLAKLINANAKGTLAA